MMGTGGEIKTNEFQHVVTKKLHFLSLLCIGAGGCGDGVGGVRCTDERR